MEIVHSPATVDGDLDRARFQRDGWLILPADAARRALTADLRAAVLDAVDPLGPPVEFEADVGYPGSPAARSATGGMTPRRLLAACTRFPAFRAWATGPGLGAPLACLLGSQDLHLSQVHHNCVMTKAPGWSSTTHWHQDIRYWSFDRPELISAWLALGHEHAGNGALQVIPGSHRLELDRGRLDAELFLRPDLADNAELIGQAVTLELQPGDLLLFHCRLFHAAGSNRSGETKLSAVVTVHAGDNHPIPDTRSADYPSLPVTAGGVP